MSNTYNFKGQVALVTGAWACHGTGFRPCRDGCHLADISDDGLQKAVDEIKSADGNAMGVLCAVSDESQVAAMVERTVAAFGGLDAVSTIRIQVPSRLDRPVEAFDRVNAIDVPYGRCEREALALPQPTY